MNQDSALVADVKGRLVAAGVQYCFAGFVDIHGVPKAKTVPIEKFEEMAHGSELFTVGANEGLGLVGPEKDECAAVPDLATATIFPWDKRFCWFASDLWYHGEPYANCPRGLLKNVAAQALAAGYVMNLGVEPEFYVFRGPVGHPEGITAPKFLGPSACYDLFQTTQSIAFLDIVARYFDELGWDLHSFDQECGNSQFEFDFGYADALTMADRMIFLRLMLKSIAESMGAVATFMAKPFSTDFRSGAHHNMSLAEAQTGKNLFDPQGGAGGELGKRYGIGGPDILFHFIGGMLEHAGAITALSCSTFNSYKGLLAQGDMPDTTWAPVLRAYGKNNRSAMLRVPMNRWCIENRLPDMSANFYLSAAINFAAGLEGVAKRSDPGEPINVNLYATDRYKGRDRRVPRTLIEALDQFEDDPLIVQTFGQEFRDIYMAQKTREWERGFYAVSDDEREKNLTYI